MVIVYFKEWDHPNENAKFRYEIWNFDVSERHDLEDAEEGAPGEYSSSFVFAEKGTYTVQIHVEDDEGLHEHEDYEVEVK